MRQIVLDTETTGLDPKQGHRVIELAGLELVDLSVRPDPRIRLADPGAVEEAGFAPIAGLGVDLHVRGL